MLTHLFSSSPNMAPLAALSLAGSWLASIPTGSPRPAAGVVAVAVVVLAVVLLVNALWELLKGPPNP